VRIYLLVGEPEKALDQLEPLLKIPYLLSPGWLRIDPTFAPLKGNPRFERLVAGTEQGAAFDGLSDFRAHPTMGAQLMSYPSHAEPLIS
jgi:hypothetical protein